MRKALHDFLTEHCQLITAWYPPHSASVDTPKPYGVIVLDDELPAVNSNRGAYQLVQVWPYIDAETSWLDMDDVVDEIKKVFKGRVLQTESGRRFTVEYMRTGRDFHDTELEAWTRPMDFRIPQLRP